MEKKLAQLFDLQRFEGNTALDALIGETLSRCGEALCDDDLDDAVAAKGKEFRQKTAADAILAEIKKRD